jgi:hypothetical protein
MSEFKIPLIGGIHMVEIALIVIEMITCSNYPDFAAQREREGGVSTLWICCSSADLGSRDQCNKSKGYKCFGDIETGRK